MGSSVRNAIVRLGIVGACLVSSPSHAETLPIEAVYPAESDNLAMLNTIHMGRFDGRDGSSMALELEQQLRNAYVRGAPYYKIYVGNNAPRVDGRVTGSATSSVESRSEVGRERVCAAQNAKGKCVEYKTIDVRCTRRNVTLNYTISVVGLRGERLYSASKPVVSSDLICPKSAGVAPVDVVVANLISGAARDLRFVFAPAQVREDIRVKEGTSGLQGQAKKTFQSAIKMTKSNVPTACGMWSEVDYLVPNHAPTLFNLGLCAESDRNYDKAQELYRRTAELDRSERYAVEANDRLMRRRKAEQQLEMQASRRKG